MTRSFILSVLIMFSVSGSLNLSLCSSPASAMPDANTVYRLKSALQELWLQKRDVERNLDDISDQMSRLERLHDISSVSSTLDQLQKRKRDQERQQQDLLLDMRDVESALRAAYQ